MFQFQLPVAIVLVVGAFASLVISYCTRKNSEGSIQLPVYNDRDDQHGGHDPFDITKVEDLIDGYPIDAEAFWNKMFWRKIFVFFLLTIVLIASGVSLGLSISDGQRHELTVYSLHVAFALYTCILSICSIRQDDVESHSKSVLHLSALSTLAFLLLGITTILPESPPPVTESLSIFYTFWSQSYVFRAPNQDDFVLLALWYASISVYGVACIVILRTPLGPLLHYPPSDIYSETAVQSITNKDHNNVCGVTSGSPWDLLFFTYTTKVVWLGNIASSLEIGDLPIIPASMRSAYNYAAMRKALRTVQLRIFSWSPKRGSGWQLAWQLVRLNYVALTAGLALATTSAILFYAPAYFLKQLVSYVEADPTRESKGWGWVYVIGLFGTNAIVYMISGQLWYLATNVIEVRTHIQLGSILFAKNLVRKDIATSSIDQSTEDDDSDDSDSDDSGSDSDSDSDSDDEEDDSFSSKAQIMTLMTIDADYVCEFSSHLFVLVDAPIQILIATIFLYNLLGVSCLVGLAVTSLFVPMNHYAGKVFVDTEESLMKMRDRRVALTNEMLGAIRMLKFMAWERSFEKRILAIREKELTYQQRNYNIETLWDAISEGAPVVVILVSFWHFAIVRQQTLTPSIAFTSITVFTEMAYALGAVPETFVSMLQTFVSLRRIEKYLDGQDVAPVPPLDQQSKVVAFQSCTVTWSQERTSTSQTSSSTASTPRQKFLLVDLTINFPLGELSFVCGKLGSGKTLLLLALLGEADVLTGQVVCPRSPPDSVASFISVKPSKEDWVVEGLCAYVPQAAWLRNATIKENILFDLPHDEERYLKTLEVCALTSDLEILEDGDNTEIGERGVNLSGGQKARVSLARAVYSRASVLLLDDVLSAVDAHTAHHLYYQCLKGELLEGRTVILVSHHVQLCIPGASYIVALDKGRVQFQGSKDEFNESEVIHTLIQSTQHGGADIKAHTKAGKVLPEEISPEEDEAEPGSESSSTIFISKPSSIKDDNKLAKKLVEDEKRAVGRVDLDIWKTYILACGHTWYWIVFSVVFLLAAATPVVENGWLKYWSNADMNESSVKSQAYYMAVYGALSVGGLIVCTSQWFIMYRGSIKASHVLYQRLLEAVLFANIRFHDTVSRGRLLNRFGSDFEGIDGSLSDNFGRSIMYGLAAATTTITLCVVGGLPFIIVAAILGVVYWNVANIYGQTSRDMSRLHSVTLSPLYSIFGETISGVAVIRAFGASSKLLRDMLRYLDTNSNPYYWMWGVNRWLEVRFNLLSAGIVGATGLACLITPSISSAMTGFALAFASTITHDLLFMVRRFVSLEQSMIALERVKEYTELTREPPEFIEPRPDPSWPSRGEIKCEDLVIRYAPDLPDVLHHLNFVINPGEKVGILGRTGSGKSTLALSFFRFAEATVGRILIDDIDISKIGLTDLRTRLTIIPQDPVILSGSLRSTLDVFEEYPDAEIYEALRRVHLIPHGDTPANEEDSTNSNVFRDLDSKVSEGGENFSTGEKQLLCMARALLKRSKILVMDEATASVDYATDELISRSIRHEFSQSTILTIAHRLRTVIDYDRVMLLDQGQIVEFERPVDLLRDPSSKFYALCKATGQEEFATLKVLAGV